MSYLPLETFPKAWIFRRQDPKIQEDDLQHIRPLEQGRAASIWRDYVSAEADHPDQFGEQLWCRQASHIQEVCLWESIWDSEGADMPEPLLLFLERWDDTTTVYFCYDNEQVVETSWGVFKRSWKNFLFFDNGPMLLGKKKKQAIQFFSNGQCHLLLRP